jgi:hypothetical protein
MTTNNPNLDMSPWRLRREIAALQVLHLVATARRDQEFRAAVHIALYDRYWRLGSWHKANGNMQRMEKLNATAARWWTTSGVENPQPPPSSPPMIVRPLQWFFTGAIAHYTSHDQQTN